MKTIHEITKYIILCLFIYTFVGTISFGLTLPKTWVASETIIHTDLNADFAALNGAINTSGVPAGGIIMWSGSTSTVPSGWHLCDGSGGTPNLTAKFVMAAGGAYPAGTTGGNATATVDMSGVSVSTVPSHGHVFQTTTSTPGAGSLSVASGTDYYFYNHVHTINDVTGMNGTHTHSLSGSGSASDMPPFYALCYIMKL